MRPEAITLFMLQALYRVIIKLFTDGNMLSSIDSYEKLNSQNS